jgi:hypothetical protein
VRDPDYPAERKLEAVQTPASVAPLAAKDAAGLAVDLPQRCGAMLIKVIDVHDRVRGHKRRIGPAAWRLTRPDLDACLRGDDTEHQIAGCRAS